MAFDWREYLEVARFLQIQPGQKFTQEAALRCAVSRSYYAAFCHARNYASTRHQFAPKHRTEDHENLRKHFQHRGGVEVARKLDQLRGWRNTCDYDDTVGDLSCICSKAISRAAEILSQLL